MRDMRRILVYADSLTWGIVPGTRRRLPFGARWPGVLEAELDERGVRSRVVEDCLNGRRTVWDDPYKPGRNGLVGLEQRIESQSPLALVILMLGTNDFQSTHVCDASDSARGTAALVGAIRGAPVEPGMPIPRILVVVPPSVRDPRGPIAAKFRGAEAKCVGLGTALRSTAAELSCAFFDAETVTTTSRVDGVHLDEDQHATLGRALVDVVLPLVADEA